MNEGRRRKVLTLVQNNDFTLIRFVRESKKVTNGKKKKFKLKYIKFGAFKNPYWQTYP